MICVMTIVLSGCLSQLDAKEAAARGSASSQNSFDNLLHRSHQVGPFQRINLESTTLAKIHPDAVHGVLLPSPRLLQLARRSDFQAVRSPIPLSPSANLHATVKRLAHLHISRAQTDLSSRLQRDLAQIDQRLAELKQQELNIGDSNDAKREAIMSERGMLEFIRVDKANAVKRAEAAAREGPPKAKTPGAGWLWEVEGRGATAWLLGTMHLSDPRITTLHPMVEDVIAQSQVLYNELDDDMYFEKLEEAGRLPAGESLKHILAPSTHSKLHECFARYGMDNSSIDGQEPWMINIKLQQIDAVRLQLDGKPLDLVLRDYARSAGLTVQGVESIEDQIEKLSSGGRSAQVQLLEQLLEAKLNAQALNGDEASASETVLQAFIESFIDGKAENLLAEVEKGSEADRPSNEMRNRRFAAHIDKEMQANPSTVAIYAFGVLHFLGSKSVVEDLRARGYQVRQRLPASISGIDSLD